MQRNRKTRRRGLLLLAAVMLVLPGFSPKAGAEAPAGAPQPPGSQSAETPNTNKAAILENATPVPTPKIYEPRWGQEEEKQTRILGPRRIKIRQPLPQVKERVLSINGSVVPGDVERVLLHNLENLKQEYLKALAKKADLTGTLTLEADLDALGVVTQAKLSQDKLAWPDLSNQTVEFVQGWVFPAPTDGNPAKIKFEIRFDLK